MPNTSIIARIADSERIKRNVKRENGKGERYERRTETWFTTERGYLVLRESDMRHEFAAIVNGKEHSVRHKPDNPRALKEVLLAGCGVPLIVEMRRETWHLAGIDAHFDDVEGLGSFVELEAINQDGTESEEELSKRCHAMLHLLGIPESDLIDGRYADLLR